MSDVVVDTNVPMVANDRDGTYPEGCPISCMERLKRVREREQVVVDYDWEILSEYKRYLKAEGQPGLGDAFYQHVLRHVGNDAHTTLVQLVRRRDGEYADFPDDPLLATFDPSDRKFAAAAKVTGGHVLNAVDSDWLDHEPALNDHDITIEFVCGKSAARRVRGP